MNITSNNINERASSAPNNSRHGDSSTLSVISELDNNSLSSTSRPNSRQLNFTTTHPTHPTHPTHSTHNHNDIHNSPESKKVKEYFGESILHTKIREGLESCSLEPIHLEVYNESYWYIYIYIYIYYK